MGKIISAAKGCVYVVGEAGGGKGWVALDPPLRGTPGAPIILDSPETTDNDNLFPAATLDDEKYVYTFGTDFGSAAIVGKILLGNTSGGGGRVLRDYFDKVRVTNRGSAISVSYPGGGAAKIMINSLTHSKVDPEYHIQYFALRGILIPPPKA